MEEKRMSESETILAQWALPADTNPYGTVHGGVIMKLIDNAAAVAAMRFYGFKSVTSHVNTLTLENPVNIGDVIIAEARVIYTYINRMIVEVEVSKEEPSTRETQRVSSSILTFVGTKKDDKGNAQYAAKVIYESDIQKEKYLKGEEWYKQKFQQQFAGISSKEA